VLFRKQEKRIIRDEQREKERRIEKKGNKRKKREE